jgi:hypothetical protein
MIDIKEKFLELTSRTYPHGTEHELFHLLPDYLLTDEFGNKYFQIGETTTMFTCHLDTATGVNTQVTHVIEDNMIKTDGKTILGADDKAGCVVMLYMIENKVPGLYYFFLGEEVGCVGSRKLSDKFKTDKLDYIKKVISFDRRALHSVITFQASQRCCSEKFAEALAAELNLHAKEVLDNDATFDYKPDNTGIYTDSAQFTGIYPECTNISVGYYSEHTFTERQDIKHLDKLAKACCLVKWEELPVERDPSVKEYKSYNYSGYSGYGGYDGYDNDWDDYWGYGYSRNTYKQPKEEKKYFIDRSYGNYASSVTIDSATKKVKSVDFSQDRKNAEKELIIELFENLCVVYKDITWTGDKLLVFYDQNHNFTEILRSELSEMLPELNFWEQETEKQKEEDIFDSPEWMF